MTFYVYALALVSGFVTVMLSVPLWRWWALRVGLVDDPGLRKIHGEAVPLAGGLAVMTGLLVPTLLGAAVLSTSYSAFRLTLLDANSFFLL